MYKRVSKAELAVGQTIYVTGFADAPDRSAAVVVNLFPQDVDSQAIEVRWATYQGDTLIPDYMMIRDTITLEVDVKSLKMPVRRAWTLSYDPKNYEAIEYALAFLGYAPYHRDSKNYGKEYSMVCDAQAVNPKFSFAKQRRANHFTDLGTFMQWHLSAAVVD